MAGNKLESEVRRQQIFESVLDTINEDFQRFGGDVPERHALIWHGYVAALIEWGLIKGIHYAHLHKILPPIEKPNPVDNIIFGDWPENT